VVGLASAASRVGAAIGTFGLPWVVPHWGLPPLMIIMAVVSVIGDNTGSARTSVPVEDLAA
jgi:MFS transporter, putative metabolite transport protein